MPKTPRKIDLACLSLAFPCWAFCYGQRIMAVTLGGTVGPHREGRNTARP